MYISVAVRNFWYSENLVPKIIAYVLSPLAYVFALIVTMRRWFYAKDIFKVTQPKVPTIVVGNITVGGSGKTPTVAYLTELVKQKNLRPGIILRGYKGTSSNVQLVNAGSDVALIGDEAYLLAIDTECPVVVGANRVEAYNFLTRKCDVDVIILDDGLQHYALGRNMEIAVIDSKSAFGNGNLLPVGPMRESISRLSAVDFVIVKGKNNIRLPVTTKPYTMEYELTKLVNMLDNENKQNLSDLSGATVHAVAGVADPSLFFAKLHEYGLTVIEHIFPDHYSYSEKDFAAIAGTVIMTAKDAVKCRKFAKDNFWFAPVCVKMEDDFTFLFNNAVEELCNVG